MKKIIFMLCVCAFLGNARADSDCAGTIIQKRNGHVFCFSNVEMNWYSAHAWCDAQGRRLATMNEACDYNGQVYGANYTTGCPNGYGTSINGTATGAEKKLWVNLQSEDGKAFYVNLYHTQYGGTSNLTSKLRALCY